MFFFVLPGDFFPDDVFLLFKMKLLKHHPGSGPTNPSKLR